MSSMERLRALNLLPLAVLLAVFGILFHPVLSDLYRAWLENNNYSHGLLVPFITAYLLWKNRRAVNLNNVRPSCIGFGVLLASLVLYVLGSGGGMVALQRIAFVTGIIGVVWYNYGDAAFKTIAFPLLFLFFMIPVPIAIEGLITMRLQLWVSDISASLLNALSITVFREGNLLHFASYSLEVAEACSGIRSLAAFLMLGCLLAYLMQGSYIRKTAIILIAFPLAIFVNIARVVGTGILANMYGESVAQGFFHDFSGMAVFIVGFFLFMVAVVILEDKRKGSTAQVSSHDEE